MAKVHDFATGKVVARTDGKLVSVVIPTLNNLTHLVACLDTIDATCKDIDYEVVVVCNAAAPATLQYLQARSVRFVALETNRGFGAACNLGADAATGQYICFLNDDTLSTTHWLHKLLHTIQNAQREHNLDAPIGAVGPMSNAVAGDQCLRGRRSQYTPHNREQVAAGLPRTFALAHFLSGFCILVDRTAFEAAGKFDERFYVGSEDNALCCALMRLGYILGITGDSYVYHHGSQTLCRPEFAKYAYGIRDVHNYYKWYSDRRTDQRLAVNYRVKILDAYTKGIFERSLRKSADFADIICVLDDGTDAQFGLTQLLDPLIDEFRKKSVQLIHRAYVRPFEERRDRNELLQMAQEAGANWILALDCDEILEDKATRERMHQLMATPIPHCFAYTFCEYTFWNDESHWRFDTPWGQMNSLRMWRIQPNRHICHGADSTLHCEHIPLQPSGAVGATSIRIKHYGYVNAAERNRKYQWYEKIDTDKRPEMIGFPDYKHLIDESELKLRAWVENNTIAVTTMMRNELNNLPQWIAQVFPFADEIVVCDTGSTDDSIEFAEWCGVRVVKQPWADNFSAPRNAALDAIKSTWALQLDMDELLTNWQNIRRMIDFPRAHGYMFYVRNVLRDGAASTSETIRLFLAAPFRYTGLIHETVDDAVKGHSATIFRSVSDILHFGYLADAASLKAKMMYYLGLCEKAMQVYPDDAKPYYSTAVHYMELPQLNGHSEQLLLRSLRCNPSFYEARKELGMLYLRKSLEQFRICASVLPPDHNARGSIDDIVRVLTPFGAYGAAVPSHVLDYMVALGRMKPDGSICTPASPPPAKV